MDRRAFLGRRPAAPAAVAPAAAPSLPHVTVATGLEPYAGPWTAREAAHLVRRTHVGATRADVVAAVVRGNATAAATALVDAARSRPLPDAPSWAGTLTGNDGTNTEWLYQGQRAWYAEMREGGLREKMTLFWHDHFATGHAVYRHAAFAVDYLTFLRERAMGTFRPLLVGIGKRPAMLRFLDNESNQAGQINENYGREILELFSMGLTAPDGSPNYTQTDVREGARALTGWVVNETTIRGEFRPARHDAGPKTIFGQTGAWGHDDLIDLIFAQRGASVAHFLATKLYAWFVHPVPNPAVVAALAAQLAGTGYDVGATVQTLLGSAHFHDAAVVGGRLKSPMEFVLGLTRELGVPATSAVLETTRTASQSLGQEVLNPPSVEGWPGYDDPLEYRAWVTTGTVPERRGIADGALYGDGPFAAYDPMPLAEQVSDRLDPYRLAADLAAHLLAPALRPDAADALADATLLDGAPDSYSRPERIAYWTQIALTSDAAARERLLALLSALVNLPEYQLA